MPLRDRARSSLLAEIGECRQRFPTDDALAALAGACPSTRQSGKRSRAVFRWSCSKKLRAAVMDFANGAEFPIPVRARPPHHLSEALIVQDRGGGLAAVARPSPARARPAGTTTSFPPQVRTAKEPASASLKNAQDVGDHLAATSCGPAPPDHDPLADIGGCEPDL